MPYDLAPVIEAAIARFGREQYDDRPVFNTASFQAAVSAEFELRDYPDSAWCVSVLERTPGVKRLLGGSYWQYTRSGEVPSEPALF